MSTTEEKKIKASRKSRSKNEQSSSRDSALDAAIATAISAPKPPKKAAQYQKSRGSQPSRKKSSQGGAKKSKSQRTESLPQRGAQTQAPVAVQPVSKPAPIVSNAIVHDSKTPLKIIPLGGLGEIGENMTLVEYGNDIVIIDCGMTFPDSEMPGVDMVIPDFTYVEKNADRVRGVLVTHGHEDHIGGIPYLLKKINVPVYATRLTIGLIENKFKEHNLGKSMLHVASPSDKVQLGAFTAEFIKVNHSIPDAVAIALHTPVGTIVHMGDFKVDYTPIEGGIIDLPKFARLGDEGVLALMSDSTNSERRGFTPSERTVGESFERLFNKAEGKRIIIATFSSNIHRVQQIINCAAQHNRKVAVFGRSMINVIGLATELGYLKAPAGVMIDIAEMHNYSDGEIVLITTGSQGEPMSALTRMATNDHRQVSITSNDFIIISARPIPGNEKFVGKVVNQLLKLGAEVVYEEMYEVHVSGHACQEEQKLIISLVRPKFFIPVHGEYKHLTRHAETAREIGIPEKNILIADVGNVIELKSNSMKVTGSVPAGKVMVDGLGVGDVGAAVLKDRKRLAEDGVIAVSATIDKIDRKLLSGPEITSKGFVYEKTNEELFQEVKKKAREVLTQELSTRHDFTAVKNKLRDEISDFVFSKTKRRPTIIVTVLDI
ncbi:MAG: RNase J family beta-CASP ribonuclease [Oscillospiraceae bacterium]|nr:RNase J family beta-CASP ribonuclease [Oscillospiraceae bacterium]